MAKLSPKALRFAENAAREIADSHPLSDRTAETWKSWHAERCAPASKTGRASTGGYIEVPGPVAEILLSAIEHRIAQMRQQLDRNADPDLGNDFAFLLNVSGALRSELEHAGEHQV